MELLEYKNNVICIGEIAILVILPKEFEHSLTEAEKKHIEDLVLTQYELRIALLGMQNEIQVCSVRSEYSCFLVILCIGTVLVNGYKFVKDYPKLREGAIAIAKDLGRLKLKLRGKEYDQGNLIRETKFEVEQAVQKALEELRNRKNM